MLDESKLYSEAQAQMNVSSTELNDAASQAENVKEKDKNDATRIAFFICRLVTFSLLSARITGFPPKRLKLNNETDKLIQPLLKLQYYIPVIINPSRYCHYVVYCTTFLVRRVR